MRTCACIFCCLFLLALKGSAQGTSNSVFSIERQIHTTGERGDLGAEKTDTVTAAVELAKGGKHDEADKLLNEVIDYFEQEIAKGDKTKKYVCFPSRQRLEEYKKGETGEVVWVDACYGRALHTRAVIQVDRNQVDRAIQTLLKASQVSPYDPAICTELGFISSSRKDFTKARGYYERAVALSRADKRYDGYRAMALRGLGFLTIELGKLDDAEAYYNQSLEVEPGSDLARSELEYIKKARAAQQGSR